MFKTEKMAYREKGKYLEEKCLLGKMTSRKKDKSKLIIQPISRMKMAGSCLSAAPAWIKENMLLVATFSGRQ